MIYKVLKSLFSIAVNMLVMGVANPSGEADSYNGLYFTQQELNSLTTAHKLNNVPVKAEHKGNAVGHIVSSFVDDQGKLNCIMHINENEVEGAVCAGLVRDGIAAELSLGYQVDVQHSDNGEKLQAGEKHVLEVSLVRKGAREACYITAYEEDNGQTKFTRRRQHMEAGEPDAWKCFDLS